MLLLLGGAGMEWGLVGFLLKRIPHPTGIYVILGSGFVFAVVVSLVGGLIISGLSRGHVVVVHMTRGMLFLSLVVTTLATTLGDTALLARLGAWIGVLALALARRLVLGPLYALGAAFFRAKRNLRIARRRAREGIGGQSNR